MHRPQWLRRKEKASSTKAVSNRLSGSSLEKIASSNPAADSPNRNVGTGDLWDRAYTELRKSHSELVDQFEKTLLSEGLGDLEATSREEQLSKIIDTKLALMNQNEWVINFAGKSVEVRKQVERLVKVVGITKDSLNVVANIDPIHIGLPVAAICLLMPLIVNDSQQRTAAVDGLSYIACLVYRFTGIEKLYLRNEDRTDTTALATEVIKLYRSVLEFQARAICQFDRGRAHQFARNVVEADEWKKRLEQITSGEAECEKIRVLLHSSEQQHGMERLEGFFKPLNAEIQQRDDTLLAALEASREEEKESECLATLRTVDYESDKTRIADHVPGTCKWFLSHDKYQSWLSETHSRLLWVTADPGCGKTVLSKLLVNSYIESATATTSVCYFFFRDGSEKNQDGTNALCALLHQLFKQKRTLLRHALPDFEHNRTKLSGLFQTLWSIFLKTTTDSEAGEIICVLDALDECGEGTREPLLQHIGGFFSNPLASSTVKFIITSRPNTMIEHALWKTYRNVSSVKLTVINNKVEQFRQRRQDKALNDDAHLEISKQLALIENRTYLWVSLIFPELEKNIWSGRGNLLQVIRTIPSTVKEAYERILSFSNDPKKARRLLHFVLASQRPLTLREMNTALAVTENRTSVDDLELEPESAFQEAVRKLCGLFISVIDSKIYLIHQTAREFLLTSTMPIPDATNIWKHSMHLSTSHFELAKTCLLYLHLSGLESEPAVLPGDFARPLRSDQTFQRHAFQSYSAKHWSFHVSRIECESVDSLMSLTLSITTCGSPAFENWIMQLTRKIYSVNMVGLFGRDIAELDQLSLAVNLEIRPLAKMLLKRGLPPTEDDTIINRAATYAIRRCPDMFFLFLDNGLDLETQSNHGNFFLHQAAAYGRIEVAQRLIEAGAAVNMEDEFSREPLHFAVRRRSKALVSLLLEKGARVNHKDKCGQTALFGDIASMPLKDLPVVRKEDIETAAYLLENGAEYEVKDKYGRSPLSWAAGYGRLLIAELLIEHGADINSRDCKGRTPLSWAAGSFFPEHRKLISLLIEHGAQINSRDKNGHTPLSYAAEHLRYQTTAMVAILIQQGAQIETRCNNMRTPLAYAAGRCLIPTLRNLIENGAAANSSDWKGNTPLHAALRNRHFLYDSRRLELYETIKLLLEMGENPNSLSIDGESPMLIVDRMESYGPSQMHDSKRFETGKEEVQNLLRRYGAGEPKLPTSPDSLCQVVAQMTVNLIETVTNSVGIELRDRQIAAKSSVQLFGGWNLHASASSIKLRRNSTIQQEIIDFRLAQTRKSEDDISNPEESQTALRPSGTPPPPDNSPPRKSPEFGLPKAQVSEKANKYAGLAPSEESEDCSYYLHRLADLQQRLFDVNRCLYYLDDHPDDSSKTVNDLIAKVIGQKTREVHESPGFCYELGSDSI